MSYRDDVAALAARKAALDEQLRQLTRERDETAKLLALPVLPNIRVAAPCNASWDAMTGDGRVRHCGECNQHVFNLSALTTEQAESLIREKHGDLCVRYYKRKDGTVLTADCVTGVEKRKRYRTVAASIVTASLVAGGVGAAVASQPPEEEHEDLDVIQGATMGKYEGYQSACDRYLQELDRLGAHDTSDVWKMFAEDPVRAEDLCRHGFTSFDPEGDRPEGWHREQFPPSTSCDDYRAAIRELAACAPETSRQVIRDAANQMMMVLHQRPPQSRRQAEDACATALDQVVQAKVAMCKPSEQRDQDRGDHGEPK